jgi:hypothetical protein
MEADPFMHHIRDQATRHWRTPYGVYNILAEGGNAEVDEYLNTGSSLGLVHGVPLFGELQ